MYRYEELDLDEIQQSPDIDPESPEALYAMAQCYRLGKGVEANQALYEEYLSHAKAAGYETDELPEKEAEEEKTAQKPEEKVRKDYASMALNTLVNLADNQDMGACYELYRRYDSEDPEVAAYLKKAVELADAGLAEGGEKFDYDLCRDIFLAAGQYYAGGGEENPWLSKEYYGKAAELGSREACRVLAGYYKSGYGGSVDSSRELFYLERALKDGNARERYELGKAYMERGQKIKGSAAFEQLLTEDDLDPSLRVLCEISYHPGKDEADIVEKAWELEKWEPEMADFMRSYYNRDPRELDEQSLPTGEQACRIAMEYTENSEKKRWLSYAAKKGNASAKEKLKELEEQEKAAKEQEERARREQEEKEKQEREEALRRRAEADRRRIEQERQNKKAAKKAGRAKRKKIGELSAFQLRIGFVLILVILAGVCLLPGYMKDRAKQREAQRAEQEEQENLISSTLGKIEQKAVAVAENALGYEQIDPFENLRIQVSGVEPYITAEAAYVGSDPFLLNDTSFTLSKSEYLSNGEVITITAKANAAAKAEYKKDFSATSMEYTVESSEYWIMADTEISSEVLEKLEYLTEMQIKDYLRTERLWVSKFTNVLGTDVEVSSRKTSINLKEIQCVGAYQSGWTKAEVEEKDKTDNYGSVYFIFRTVADYDTSQEDLKGERELYYALPIQRIQCNEEGVQQFSFFTDSKLSIHSTFEDAEFVIYRDVKPQKKLEI